MSPALAILLSCWVGVSLQVVPNGIGLLASSSAGLPTQRNLVDISIVLLLHLFQMSPEHRRRQLLSFSRPLPWAACVWPVSTGGAPGHHESL